MSTPNESKEAPYQHNCGDRPNSERPYFADLQHKHCQMQPRVQFMLYCWETTVKFPILPKCQVRKAKHKHPLSAALCLQGAPGVPVRRLFCHPRWHQSRMHEYGVFSAVIAVTLHRVLRSDFQVLNVRSNNKLAHNLSTVCAACSEKRCSPLKAFAETSPAVNLRSGKRSRFDFKCRH